VKGGQVCVCLGGNFLIIKRSRNPLFTSVNAIFLLIAAWSAMAAPDTQQLEKDIQFVRHLVNDSEAAKKISADSNDQAKALQQQARDLLQQASEALQAGDTEQVKRLLGQAKLTMFQAARAVGDSVKAEKQQDDFQQLLQSVDALLAAQKNYLQDAAAKDYPDKDAAEKTTQHVEQLLAQAREQFDQGKREDAAKILKDAYVTLKVSLSTLRNGQTVVRSLNFANKEEEYRYELGRNDTHKMLVQTLLKEKLDANPGLAKLVDMNMQIAQDLRDKAKSQAEQGDYDAAVESLERSTGQIIRAIRAAGIYIPG